MSRTTPRVEKGSLYDGPDVVALDTPHWQSWLDDDAHRSFHFSGHTGEFTARKERKQRGSWYWVAYRQVHGKLYKTYLGKAACLSLARLLDAAATLNTLASAPAANDKAASGRQAPT